MLQCTLPYTIYQPFTNGSGSTADEMFFGRVSELASIRDMNGTSIVYGGRQLGKTALLERAMHLDHNPAHKVYAIKADFKGHRGEREFLDILVSACNDAFEKNGIKLSPCSSILEFCSQIRRLLDNDRIATLRLLLDETDDFLDSISATSYNEILPLIELQRGSNRRFKFVLAGLHNVCRAKNATRNNGLFGQLGNPLCVKPLTPADARNLLVRPLRYLGFRVTNESHVDTILTNTNYYPGIIQFFGYTLVQTLATHYTQYYLRRGESNNQHILSLVRKNNTDAIGAQIWKAQLQVLFPMLEIERVSFVEHYHQQIQEALSERYYDFKTGRSQLIYQFGDVISDPDDAELGTIYRMTKLKHNADTSQYLLYIPDEKSRSRIELLHDLRNALAHGEPCAIGKVAEFIDGHPFNWEV